MPATIRISSFDLPSVVQSPMANCSDLAFRLVARSQGMAFAFLEMISSEALVRDVWATHEMMKSVPEDRPLGAQLVGCNPDVMGEAAAKIESLGYDLLDINLGCPVPKIVSQGGGSRLLREPDLAGRIFDKIVRAVRRIPVTVKMRLGFSDGTGQEAARIARIAQDAGVSAIAVHGRTREQGYSGSADYAAIRTVKEAVSIPVIGNGDVVDAASALRLRAVSGCDGVMVARGALGNPWLYKEIEAALDGCPAPAKPDLAERKRVLLRHVDLQVEHDPRPVGPLRRITTWYFKDMPGVAQFRDRVNHAETVDEMRDLIHAFGTTPAIVSAA